MPELMKGHVWSKQKHKMEYPCRVEVKYDEIRCHVRVAPEGVLVGWPAKRAQFLSYAGKPLHNMQGFEEMFVQLSRRTGYLEFDCGFEANGNYNDSYRWVRSSRGIPADLQKARIRFYLFGLPELPDTLRDSLAEFEYVQRTATQFESQYVSFNLPRAAVANNEAEVEGIYQDYIDEGFEGAMIKNLGVRYEKGKRSYGWLKMKPEDDEDGVIIGFEEAICGKDQPAKYLREGDRLGRVGSVLLQMQDGSTAAPGGIPHDLGRDMMDRPEKYLGRWVEFKYMERDRQGGYRHPRFHRLREDKE